MKIFRVAPLFLAASVAGCAGNQGDFPSLLPRPVEQRSEEVETPEPPAPAAADSAFAAQLAELLQQARAGDSAFNAALPAAERAVNAARQAAPASEPWVEAQRLISILDSARSPTSTALASLDELLVARAEGASRDAKIGGVEEAVAARAEAEAINARQAERLTVLRDALRRP